MNTIRTESTRFVDELGRERIFNGVNIVDKSDYKPGEQKYAYTVDDELLSEFRDKGFNLIRLGFTWAKLEPTPGDYNDEYLDEIDRILELCEKYGIYAYLDMHQDLYSPKCNGDGAPAWATITDQYEVKPIKGVWAAGYFWGKYCQRAFDNFWANREVNGKGLQEWYADCWTHVAERFKDKPALFGFDLMNEPFPGMAAGKAFKKLILKAVRVILFDREIKQGKLFADAVFSKDRVPKVLEQISSSVVRKATSVFDDCIRDFDINKYAPFLSRVTKAIRGVTDKGVIMLDNSYWSNTTVPFSAPPITVDGKREQNQAFAPHAYDFMVDTELYKYASNERVSGMFAQHKKSQDRLHMPVIVGEWGGGGEGEGWLPHVSFLLDMFDSNKWSNTYWCYTDGWLKTPLMKIFSRPYPKAIPGVIESYHCDEDKKVFSLAFECECGGDAVICVPRDIVSITVDGAKADYTKENSDVTVKVSGGRHTVEVRFN